MPEASILAAPPGPESEVSPPTCEGDVSCWVSSLAVVCPLVPAGTCPRSSADRASASGAVCGRSSRPEGASRISALTSANVQVRAGVVFTSLHLATRPYTPFLGGDWEESGRRLRGDYEMWLIWGRWRAANPAPGLRPRRRFPPAGRRSHSPLWRVRGTGASPRHR